MKSKNELYQEIEKWYKKQERIVFLKYALPDFFQRLVHNVKGQNTILVVFCFKIRYNTSSNKKSSWQRPTAHEEKSLRNFCHSLILAYMLRKEIYK